MAKKKSKTKHFVWVVAYINSDFLKLVQEQLDRFQEYDEVEPYIPTIKVLKKQFKNKEQFEEVPLLYHYGFFKVPRKYAIHYSYLENMQKNISCIHGWVKDPVKGSLQKIPVATATAEEISELIRTTINLGAHSSEDLDLIKPGDYVVLRGYPWEGMECEYLGVNDKTKKVRVKMFMFLQDKEVEVPFDAVFFNLYRGKGYDDSVSNKHSFDDMQAKGTLNNFLGKLEKRKNNGDK